jgi:hypothetical protein
VAYNNPLKQQLPNRQLSGRDDAHAGLKPGKARGRNGEILSRNKDLDDPRNVPEHLKEDGWTYQWNRCECFGKPDPQEINRMMNNGWRYVKPDSKLGRIYGVTGADFIEIGGLVLMERPKSLTDEAIEEDMEKTGRQYAELMSKSSDLVVPDGFEASSKIVKRVGTISASDLGDVIKDD